MPGKKGQADITPGAITPAPRTVLARGDWWEIRAAPGSQSGAGAQPRAAELLIYGDIGEDIWGGESTSALGLVRALADIEADTLTARINSYGGSVADGLVIHNALRHHPAQVTTSIDGVALSIASLIAVAGDVVAMAQNARLMIHAPWGGMVGNANDARKFADVLDGYARSMASSYARKTGQTVDEAAALLLDGADHWYSADEALAAGLIDTITDALAIAASLPARFRPGAALNHPPATASRQPPAAPAAQQPEGNSMPAQTTPPDNVVDIDAVRAEAKAQALAADRERRAAIQARFTRHLAMAGVPALLDACLDDAACQPEAAGLKLLDHIGAAATPINGALGIAPGEDEQDKHHRAASDALLARAGVHRLRAAGVPDLNIDLAGNPFRGQTLMDLARASVRRRGQNPDGMDKRAIVAAAFQTTDDFPVLLENVMHKSLQRSFVVAALTWQRFCATGQVSDFRAHTRYRVGSIGNLDALNEHGEFTRKAIPDGEKATITAGTRGNIIAITREVIINDDLGALTSQAMTLGRASARTVESAVYARLAENSGAGPTMQDGQPLFHASHNNIAATAGAPAVAIIEAMRVQMASQMDIGANDYLDVRPAVWLGPLSLGGTAREVLGAEYNDEASKNQKRPNIVRGLVDDIVDTPRLSGTAWYLFANPVDAPVLEVAFLDGVQEPYLETRGGWDVDGAEMKVRLDFGTAGIDYRGAVRNAG